MMIVTILLFVQLGIELFLHIAHLSHSDSLFFMFGVSNVS